MIPASERPRAKAEEGGGRGALSQGGLRACAAPAAVRGAPAAAPLHCPPLPRAPAPGSSSPAMAQILPIRFQEHFQVSAGGQRRRRGVGVPLFCLTPSLGEGGPRPRRAGRALRAGRGGQAAGGPIPSPPSFPAERGRRPAGRRGKARGAEPAPGADSRLPLLFIHPSVNPSIPGAASPRRADRPRFVQSHSSPEGPPAPGRGRRRAGAALLAPGTAGAPPPQLGWTPQSCRRIVVFPFYPNDH